MTSAAVPATALSSAVFTTDWPDSAISTERSVIARSTFDGGRTACGLIASVLLSADESACALVSAGAASATFAAISTPRAPSKRIRDSSASERFRGAAGFRGRRALVTFSTLFSRSPSCLSLMRLSRVTVQQFTLTIHTLKNTGTDDTVAISFKAKNAPWNGYSEGATYFVVDANDSYSGRRSNRQVALETTLPYDDRHQTPDKVLCNQGQILIYLDGSTNQAGDWPYIRIRTDLDPEHRLIRREGT